MTMVPNNMGFNTDEIGACWIGTDLARRLGLSISFFSQAHRDDRVSLQPGIETKKIAGLVMVRLPEYDSKIVRDEAYTAVKIEPGDDYAYDYVLKLTNKTSVGFYR